MIEPKNSQAKGTRLIPHGHQRRYTGEILRRTRPKTYRAIKSELAEPNASVNGIARRYRVSNHTVMGIREREAEPIAERKKTLAAKLANVAELGAERLEILIELLDIRSKFAGPQFADFFFSFFEQVHWKELDFTIFSTMYVCSSSYSCSRSYVRCPLLGRPGSGAWTVDHNFHS